MAEYRDVVIPGEKIDGRKGRKLGNGVYQEGEIIFSKFVGVPRIDENEISVIPLSGVYLPNMGDKVIGIVEGVEISGWLVDINSPYAAFLPIAEAVDEFVDMARTDISRYFDVGDIVFCRLSKVTKNKTVQVSMRDPSARKLYGGIIIKVTPTKIPRIIGKAGSMISLIKNKTKCDIYTGQNGVIWIRGEDKAKAIEAILTIEKESHTMGLTERIESLLGV
ncbi:MAG: RNA-binding protein [Candidatus Aenigmarchaeota archaeon]|nr:RNA-binding protein [Candidatus Aenigmarchaeota archaeon]